MNGDKNDIKPGDFPNDLNWTSDKALGSLDRLYEFANAECKKAIDWYYREKGSKQIAGYFFRVGSIVALAVSGIIPVLGEIFKKNDVPGISSAWATVALAVFGLFIALDRFGGYTSGWIRYITSGQALSDLQSDFRVEWEKYRLSVETGPLDTALVQQGIERCKIFLSQVHLIVKSETDQWAQEFKKALLELEENAKK
jgi:hypothetical protein